MLVNRVTVAALFAIFLAIPLEGYTYAGYAAYLLALGVFLVAYFVQGRAAGRWRLIDLVPGAFLCCWAYGVVLGLIHDNPREAMVRNFAGMICYGFYYMFMYSNMPARLLMRLILWAALLNMILGFAFSAYIMATGQIVFSGLDVMSGNARAFYSANVSLVFCFLAVSLFLSLGTLPGWQEEVGPSPILRWFVNSDIAFFLGSVYYVLLPFGKGFIVNYLILMGAAPLLALLRRRFHPGFRYYGRLAVVVAGLLALFFSPAMRDARQGVSDFFSFEHASNVARFEQSEALRSEFTIFGAGLGAGLKSQYTRDALGYGFEQSYENVLHKFGVFSLIIFAAYVYSLLAGLRCFNREASLLSVTALAAAFAFLIPSAGNPMLYATMHVAMHCIALYICSERGRQPRPMPALRRPGPRMMPMRRSRTA